MIYQPYPFKRCVTCKEPLPFRAFSRNRTKSDGLQNVCKVCCLAYTRANPDKIYQNVKRYRRSHPEKMREIGRTAYWENPEVFRERNRIRYRNDPEKAKRASRKYAQVHPELVKQSQRHWYEANHQKALESSRQYAKTHPEWAREAAKKHRQRYPEKIKEYHRNDRARRKKAEGKHTADDMRDQYTKQNSLCYWCSEPLPQKWHADHVIPLNRGGTNWPMNMVCACPKCNRSKSDSLPYDEWQPPDPLFPR